MSESDEQHMFAKAAMTKLMEDSAVHSGLVDSPTIFAARKKFEAALKSISDDGLCDAGMSAEGFDFWVKHNGIEYFVEIKKSWNQLAKERGE